MGIKTTQTQSDKGFKIVDISSIILKSLKKRENHKDTKDTKER
jgi:hypothetical protein